MNNDLVVYPGWLGAMVEAARSDARIGLVNPEWNIPKRLNDDHRRFYTEVMRHRKPEVIATDFCRGFCFLVRPEVLSAVSGLDDAFSPGYYDDWDLSMRALRAGFISVRALNGFVFHVKNVSYGRQELGTHRLLSEKRVVFEQRWGKPRRLMILDGGAGISPTGLSELLDRQNQVTVWSSKAPLLRHTNCRWHTVPRVLLALTFIGVCLDQLRLTARRRADHVCFTAPDKGVFVRLLRWLGARPVIFNVGCAVGRTET
jgi:hypothetical protein